MGSIGETGTYGISVASLTNIDTPYVYFQFGVPELGNNEIFYSLIPQYAREAAELEELPYLEFTSNLRGAPEGGDLDHVPWASLVPDVNTGEDILAPGYILDLPTESHVGRTFNVQIYPGLNEVLEILEPEEDIADSIKRVLKEHGIENAAITDALDSGALDKLNFLGMLETAGLDQFIAFQFNTQATATVLTREEFIAQQTAEALKLRTSILTDDTVSSSLLNLAADEETWTTAYLAALEEAGLLRPEGEAPPVRQSPLVVSLLSSLATGILLGTGDQTVITDGNLVKFFEQIRSWYGTEGGTTPPLPSDAHAVDFNVYVPFGDIRLGIPHYTAVAPPSFAPFINLAGGNSELVSLTGPFGAGAESFVPSGEPLPYTIQFENGSTAVGEIRIISELDPDLDAHSFRLGDLRIGDIEVNIPENRAIFEGDFNFAEEKGFILRVSAGIDGTKNTATWLLQAIDPNTGEVIQNPDLGILLANDSGFVGYTVAPLGESATGTEITASARILFNTTAPADTQPVLNILDAVAPSTELTVTPLRGSYLVQWIATDDVGGSGIEHVTVYVAENGGDFRIWQHRTTENEAIYEGTEGHSYEFLAIATDVAGNQEIAQINRALPGDGSTVNLGNLPTFDRTTTPIAPPPAKGEVTNPLFELALQQIPAASSENRPSEFETVISPFVSSSFATGIPGSEGNIGPLAIVTLPDGSVIASGGLNRGSLYHFDLEGGEATNPLITLPYPIFDLALDPGGNLWATTGGGPLLQLDPSTEAILAQYGDGLTQSLAIDSTGLIYLT